jgi:hypothetical protein
LIASSASFAGDESSVCLRKLHAEEIPSQGADVFVGDLPLPINEERLGNPVDSVIDGDAALGVAAVWICDAELLDEATCPLFRIPGYSPPRT